AGDAMFSGIATFSGGLISTGRVTASHSSSDFQLAIQNAPNEPYFLRNHDVSGNFSIHKNGTGDVLTFSQEAADWDYQGTSIVDVAALNMSGKITVDGGAKISVMNKNRGGTENGIFWYDSDDAGWVDYMAQAGATSPHAATTVSSLDGRTGWHVRRRVPSGSDVGFLWENSSEQCLMSLAGDTGDLYTKGNFLAGTSELFDTDSATSAVVSGGGNVSSQYGLFESQGYRVSADVGRLGILSFTNFNSTEVTKRAATFEAWSEGSNTEAGQLRFYTHDGTTLRQNLTVQGSGSANFHNNAVVGVDEIQLSGSRIIRNGATGVMHLSGGSHQDQGANIVAYGEGYVGDTANDMLFRYGATSWLHYDHSDTLVNFQSNDIRTAGKLTVDGGAKIAMGAPINGEQNGIFWSNAVDTNWGTYLGAAGANRSLSNGKACTSFDGRYGSHIRNRVYNGVVGGFIWENHSEQCLMSLTADTGDLYLKGNVESRGRFFGPKAGEASPIYSFADDQDTGVMSAGTNRVGFTTDGLLRWEVRADGDLVAQNASVLRRVNNDSALVVSGGQSPTHGFTATFYGGDHATNAGDGVFATAGVNAAHYQAAYNTWNWQSKSFTNVGTLVKSNPYIERNTSDETLHMSGGSNSGAGGNMVLYGEAHPDSANDTLFRAGLSPWLHYDHSASEVDFKGNAITNASDVAGVYSEGETDALLADVYTKLDSDYVQKASLPEIPSDLADKFHRLRLNALIGESILPV
ncbi:MAG: hypothetical protein AB3N28_00865, partial [Kordiimonas sp.]